MPSSYEIKYASSQSLPIFYVIFKSLWLLIKFRMVFRIWTSQVAQSTYKIKGNIKFYPRARIYEIMQNCQSGYKI